MKRIYNYLKSKKIDVYFPGQHTGLCKKPYIVIHKTAQIAELGTNKVGIQGVDILLYAPKNSYVKAEEFEDKIRKLLKDVLFLKKTGFETAWIFENDIEALSKSIEYVIQKELEG
ncbi:MAG: hypothetical protein ACTJGH_00420 [Peptoniphilaceae bacterium]